MLQARDLLPSDPGLAKGKSFTAADGLCQPVCDWAPSGPWLAEGKSFAASDWLCQPLGVTAIFLLHCIGNYDDVNTTVVTATAITLLGIPSAHLRHQEMEPHPLEKQITNMFAKIYLK